MTYPVAERRPWAIRVEAHHEHVTGVKLVKRAGEGGRDRSSRRSLSRATPAARNPRCCAGWLLARCVRVAIKGLRGMDVRRGRMHNDRGLHGLAVTRS